MISITIQMSVLIFLIIAILTNNITFSICCFLFSLVASSLLHCDKDVHYRVYISAIGKVTRREHKVMENLEVEKKELNMSRILTLPGGLNWVV